MLQKTLLLHYLLLLHGLKTHVKSFTTVKNRKCGHVM